jgi:hypothetical protein
MDNNGNFVDNFDGNATGALGMKYLNGIANSIKSLQTQTTEFENNRYNNLYFHNWLPTEMQFSISLQIQPNLLKYKKKFNLNWYKMGLFNLDDYKGGASVYLPTETGIKDATNCEADEVVTLEVQHQMETTYDDKKTGKGVYDSLKENRNGLIKADNYSVDWIKDTSSGKKVYHLVQKWTTDEQYKRSDINNAVNKQIGLNSKGRTYVFDRSGWTW